MNSLSQQIWMIDFAWVRFLLIIQTNKKSKANTPCMLFQTVRYTHFKWVGPCIGTIDWGNNLLHIKPGYFNMFYHTSRAFFKWQNNWRSQAFIFSLYRWECDIFWKSAVGLTKIPSSFDRGLEFSMSYRADNKTQFIIFPTPGYSLHDYEYNWI